MTEYEVLGAAPAGIDAIQMRRVVEEDELVYLWLPGLEGASVSSDTVAKLAISCFIDSMRTWNHGAHQRKTGFLVVDELQVIAGQNLERVFQQITGAGISLVTGNQGLANLNTRDTPNLARTVWTNTRAKLSFGLLDARDRDDWIGLGGEDLSYLLSRTTGTSGGKPTNTTTAQPVVRPRLTANAINQVNNTTGRSLVYLNGDDGFAQFGGVPREVWSPFPISKAEYDKYASTPWPTMPQTGPGLRGPARTVINRKSPEQHEHEAQARYAKLVALTEQLARGEI